MKTKNSYLVMSGETVGETLSSKLRTYQRARRSIRAARRMGYKQAYISRLAVSPDAKLLK